MQRCYENTQHKCPTNAEMLREHTTDKCPTNEEMIRETQQISVLQMLR